MKILIQLTFCSLLLALASCSSTGDVVSKNVIQKRKYNKGFHVDLKSKIKPEETTNDFAHLPVEVSDEASVKLNKADEAAMQELTSPVKETGIANQKDDQLNFTEPRLAVKDDKVSLSPWFGIKMVSRKIDSVSQTSVKHSSFSGSSVAYDKSQLIKWIIVALIGLVLAIIGRALLIWFIWYLGWLIWTVGVVLAILVLLEII